MGEVVHALRFRELDGTREAGAAKRATDDELPASRENMSIAAVALFAAAVASALGLPACTGDNADAQAEPTPATGTPDPDAGAPLGDGILSITPATRSFGTVAIGATSDRQRIIVTNLGEQSTGNIMIAFDGPNAPDFYVVASGCNTSLFRNDSCEIVLTFRPVAVGTKTAQMRVKATPGGTATTQLIGKALEPASSILSPSLLNFGTVLATSATVVPPPGPGAKATFWIFSVGGFPTAPFTIELSGTGASDFTLADNTCTASLQPDEACTFDVYFRPVTVGDKYAVVRATSIDGIMRLSSSLIGAGSDDALLVVTPISFDFGSVAVGATSTAPFSIENQGGQTTGKIAYALIGINFAEFSLNTTACPEALDRGAHCTAAVTFAPMVAGTKAATLFITATPGSHTGATLTGTATATAGDAGP